MNSPQNLVIAGIGTNLIRAGKGEPLILLHGLGATNYSWRYTVPELAKHYEVFAPDLPGFGHADKPRDFDYSFYGLHAWLLKFMDHFGLERARFAGNSMGGVLSLWTAMESPSRVETMALLGAPTYVENRPLLLWPLGWPVIGRLLEWSLGDLSLRVVARTAFVDRSRIDARMVEEYGRALKTAAGRRAVAEFVRRAIPADHEERIKRYADVKQPTLVLVGEQDNLVSRAAAQRLVDIMPNAVLAMLENCGHASPEDAPERVNARLIEFFKS